MKKRFNFTILIYIVLGISLLIGIYLILYPYIPEIKYQLFDKNKTVVPYPSAIEKQIKEEGKKENKDIIVEQKEIPKDNRLVIPSIGVDIAIVEGKTENALNKGAWRIPGTGKPGVSNMVLAGHRMSYGFSPDEVRSKLSFYHLDKLKEGEYVLIYWQGKEYSYVVTETKIVKPTQLEIEAPTKEHILTLYTCTPIGTSDQRLVKIAKPVIL